MSYIEHSLSPGEAVVYQTRLHWIVLFWPLLAALACILGGGAILGFQYFSAVERSDVILGVGWVLIAIGMVWVGIGVLARHKTEMAVTTKRVIIKTGVLSNRTIELFLSKIESVEVEQSLWGRILGFGSIFLRGTGGTAEPFATISHPLEFRRQVQQQIEALGTGKTVGF